MLKEKFYPDWLCYDDVKLLLACLQQNGLVANFVGGSVRDSLLGLQITDLDMAIASPPETVKAALAKSNIRTADYGLDHGTVTAILNGRCIEITSLRTDVKTYGRRAQVEFGSSWQQDSERRDFTINAIYLSPQGDLWDPQAGIPDLHGRIVRFIGDPQERVKEDFLRILRFFRFSAFYGRDDLHTESLAACADHAHSLQQISIERIRHEIIKLLTSPRASVIIKIMMDVGIFKHILPDINVSLSGLRFLEEQAKKYSSSMANEGWLRLVSLVSSDQWLSLSKLWKFSRKEVRRLLHVLDNLNRIPQTNSQQKLLVYNYDKQCLRDLILLSGLSYDTIYDTIEQWQPPVFPVTGSDVMGHVPLKSIGATLSNARSWWVTERNMQADKQQCLDYIMQQVKNNG